MYNKPLLNLSLPISSRPFEKMQKKKDKTHIYYQQKQ